MKPSLPTTAALFVACAGLGCAGLSLAQTVTAPASTPTTVPLLVQPPQIQVPAPVTVPVPATTPAPTQQPAQTQQPVQPPGTSTPLVMPTSIQVTPGSLTPPTVPAAPTTGPSLVPVLAPTVSPTNPAQINPVQVNPGTPAQPAITFGPAPMAPASMSPTTTVTPARPAEKLVAWGSTNLTTLTGGLNFGVSYPVAQVSRLKVLARGSGEIGLVTAAGGSPFTLQADALASYPLGNNTAYAGPGLLAGIGGTVGIGLTAGYRASFTDRLGGFIEGHLNRVWVKSAPMSANGIRTGVTYRF